MVENKIADLLGSNHPDVDYLRQADISLVLSKALAETFKAKPQEPKQHFAKYLLNYAAQKRKENDRKAEHETVGVKKEDRVKEINIEKKQQEDQVKADQAEADKKDEFFTTLKKSEDLADNLQSLTDFIKENTKATGCYIGHLDYPSIPVEEDSDATAHRDTEAEMVLKFKQASKDQEFMIGEVLKPFEGVTHDVFNFEPEVPPEVPELEEGEEPPVPEEKDILEAFKHVYVKEVVREKRMHFTRVPRLGSYMAIPLIYKSCLFDEALEEAVRDYEEVQKKRENQEIEKEAWQAKQDAEKAAAEEAGNEWEAASQEWEEINFAPFLTQDRKLVLCLDTMGQDREFTDEEKRFALNTVKSYIEIWEQEEVTALTADRARRAEMLSGETAGGDAQAEEEHATEIAAEIEEYKWKSDETDKIYFMRHITEEDYVPEEELASIEQKYKMLTVMASRFEKNKEWLEYVENLRAHRVMKYPEIFQSLLFLTAFKREDICEPKTNKLCWKTVREQLTSKQIVKAMQDYQLYGQTKDRLEAKGYQTVTYCEKVIEGLTQDVIEKYHAGLGKLFKWLQMAIAGRKQDITRRKALQQRAKETRVGKQQEAEEREKAREEYIVEMEEKWREDTAEQLAGYEKYIARQAKKEAGDELNESEQEAEDVIENDENFEAPLKPVWDTKESYEQFDEDHPQIEIPPEVIDDIDTDWPMEEEDRVALVDAYWASKEG